MLHKGEMSQGWLANIPFYELTSLKRPPGKDTNSYPDSLKEMGLRRHQAEAAGNFHGEFFQSVK